MNLIERLEKIIAQQGSCGDVSPSYCEGCPLSKLKTQANGSPMNCLEAVGAQGLPEDEANAKYLHVAMEKLADIKMEEILGDDNGIDA